MSDNFVWEAEIRIRMPGIICTYFMMPPCQDQHSCVHLQWAITLFMGVPLTGSLRVFYRFRVTNRHLIVSQYPVISS